MNAIKRACRVHDLDLPPADSRAGKRQRVNEGAPTVPKCKLVTTSATHRAPARAHPARNVCLDANSTSHSVTARARPVFAGWFGTHRAPGGAQPAPQRCLGATHRARKLCDLELPSTASLPQKQPPASTTTVSPPVPLTYHVATNDFMSWMQREQLGKTAQAQVQANVQPDVPKLAAKCKRDANQESSQGRKQGVPLPNLPRPPSSIPAASSFITATAVEREQWQTCMQPWKPGDTFVRGKKTYTFTYVAPECAPVNHPSQSVMWDRVHPDSHYCTAASSTNELDVFVIVAHDVDHPVRVGVRAGTIVEKRVQAGLSTTARFWRRCEIKLSCNGTRHAGPAKLVMPPSLYRRRFADSAQQG